MKKLLILTICALAFGQMNAQMSGTVTVPGTYPTLAAAITALNTSGVSGATSIEVSASETAPAGGFVINSIAGASATNTVSIKAIGAVTLTAQTGSSTTTDGIIKLNGCDWVTIDGFTIMENPANTTATTRMEWGIAMVAPSSTDGVQNCTIKNCTISLTRGYANTAIYSRQHTATSAASAVAPTSAAGAHSNNTIINNTISDCVTGIFLHGHSAFPGQNNKVGDAAGTGNNITVGDNAAATNTSRGIVLSGQQSCIVRYNSVNSATSPIPSTSIFGIWMASSGLDGGTASSYTVSNNTVSISTATATGSLHAIRTEAAATIVITENTIQNCSMTSVTTGIGTGITAAASFNISVSTTISNNTISNNTFGSAVTTTGAMALIRMEGPRSFAESPVANITGNQLINNTIIGATGAHRLIQVLGNCPTTNISNNVIRDITLNASLNGFSSFVACIDNEFCTGTVQMNGNVIRNVKNSAATGNLYAIRAMTTTNTNVDMNNNIVTNVGFTNTSGVSNVFLKALLVENGPGKQYNMVNNLVDTLFIRGTNTATANVIYGLQNDVQNQTGNTKNIAGNIIRNVDMGIRSGTSNIPAAMRVAGGSNGIISGNIMQNIGYTAAGPNAGYVTGLSIGYPDDSITVRNNFISGIYAQNTNLASIMHIIGIDQAAGNSGQKVKYYNNTIKLDDALNSGNGNGLTVSGFRFGNATIPSIELRNNIINVDVTPGLLGNAMTVRRESGTAATVPVNFAASSNNNIYYNRPVSACPSCYVYGEGYSPVSNGFQNDGNFNNSCNGYINLMFPRETNSRLENNLVAGTISGTYIPAGNSYAESGGVALPFVTTDFSGTSRSTPPDCGALEFSGTGFSSTDVAGPRISFADVVNSICLSNYSITANITDGSGVNTTAGVAPRLWYKKKTEGDFLAATNTSADNGWKYAEATNTTSPFAFAFDYSILNSPIAGNDTIQYFITAQDLLGNIGSNQVSFASGFCAPSAALSAAAFPLSTTLPVKSFRIIPAPVTVTTTAVKQYVCNGDTLKLSLTGDLATGASYQWQSATSDTGPWTNISGATGSTYTAAVSTTSPFFYHCVISCGGTVITTSSDLQIGVYAQLAGNYTIDKSMPASATNFISFSAAASALNCGISGPVVIDVFSGPYTDKFVLGNMQTNPTTFAVSASGVPGSSAVNTITINGNGNKISTVGNFDNPSTVLLNGADYVTINNLVMEGTDNNPNNPYAMACHLWGQADNNKFNDCTFISPKIPNNNGEFAPFSISNQDRRVQGSGVAQISGSNNTVTNCTMIGGSRGVVIAGVSGFIALNNKLINCTVTDFRLYGILTANVDGITISGCTVEQPTTTAATTSADGIFLSTNTLSALVEKNTVRKLFWAVPTSTSNCGGITCPTGASGKENVIVNNLIHDLRGLGTTTGINLGTGTFIKCYHNTISLDNTAATGSTTTTTGISHAGSATSNVAEIRNNLISITRGGLGTKVCLSFSATATARISNNNNLYMGSKTGLNFVATNTTTQFATLAAWKAGTTYDAASTDFNPYFTSLALGNFRPNNGLMDNKGAAGYAATDITGAARSATTPDVGAYEYTVSTLDAAISWSSPIGQQTAGLKTITVNIANVGAGNITDLTLAYFDALGVYVQETFSGLNIAPGATAPISFVGQYNLQSSVSMTVNILDVNGLGLDAFDGNNSIVQYFCVGLSGTYTIDFGAPTGGTNFATFGDAVKALSCGIFGPVVFNVTAGQFPFYETIEIGAINGASAVNTITFNGNGNKITYATDAINPSTVMLYGADFITFNNLIMETTATGSTANAFACHLWNGADNNRFNNCTFIVPQGATSSTLSAAFSISGNDVSTQSSPTTGNTGGNGNVLNSCTFQGGFFGASFFHNTTAGSAATGNQVINSLVQDFHQAGISISHQNGFIARNNVVERPTKQSAGTSYGIWISSGSINSVVDRNYIKDLFVALPTTPSLHTNQGNGIANNSSSATLNNENIITNNVINGMSGNGQQAGVFLLNSQFCKVYYNTVNLNDVSSTTTSAATYGIYASNATGSGIDIRNNVVSITRGGTASKYCIYLASATPVCNYNNLYMGSTTGTTNYIGTTTGTTSPQLTTTGWQSTGKDLSSTFVNPLFIDVAGGNLRPISAAMNNFGIPISGITTDYTGATRNATTPDAGAYEFEPADSDAAITWVSPVSPIGPGTQIITVNVANVGLTTITSLLMSYSDGVNTVNQTFSGLNIATGENQNISFSTPYVFSTSVVMTVVQSKVNNINDPTPANSTLTRNVCIGLNGTYTIDQFTPTGGFNFASFTDAINALICGGVAGPVVINVSPAVYTEQIEIPEIAGSSATNTVTFNGAGLVTVQYNATQQSSHTLLLSGADYFTFNDITFKSLNSNDAMTCHLWNGSNYNKFNNCTFEIPFGNGTADIPFSITPSKLYWLSSTGVPGGSNNTLTGCTTKGGYGSCVFVGTSASPDVNNKVVNCSITEGYVYQCYGINQNNMLVSGCTMEKPTRSNTHSFYGFYLSGVTFSTFEKNVIRNPFGGGSQANQSSTNGIYSIMNNSIGGDNKFINNLIYNMNSANAELYGIQLANTTNNTVWHNTIVLDGQTASTNTGYGIMSYGNSGIDIRNNNIYITRSGATNYGLHFLDMAGKLCDNNNIYVNSISATNYIGRAGQVNVSSFAVWKTVNFGTFDQNSTNVDPMFVSLGSDFRPSNNLMNNKGATGIPVTTDIAGTARPYRPDAGAYEFGTLPPPTLKGKVYLNHVDAGLMSVYMTTTAQTPPQPLWNFPLSDPYSAAPLNSRYVHVNNGPVQTTNASSITTNAITDWIFLELRSGTPGATSVVYTQAALLQADGDIVSAADGRSAVEFTNAPEGDYYIAVRHRSHTGFRTSNAYALSSFPLTLDFSNNSVALNGSFPLSQVGNVWAMNGGDANFDGSVDAVDSITWETENGLFDDYKNNSDYNMDGSVDSIDTITWENNNGKYEELD